MKKLVLAVCIAGLLAWSCGDDSGTNPDDGGGQNGGDPKLGQLGFVPIYGASGVCVSGTTAYVVADSGFYVVDVSNPASPSVISTLAVKTPFSHAADVFVDGSIAYIANYNSGLVTVDVSSPSHPDSLTQWIDGVLQCWNVQVADGYAYLAYEDSGVVILNVSNPANPVLSGRVRVPARDLALLGSTLQVMCYGDTVLRTYNITSPGNLSQKCYSTKSSSDPAALRIGASAQLTAIAMDSWNDWSGHGLKLFEPNCGATVSVATPGYAQNVAVSGSHIILGDYDSGTRVYKYASGAAPEQIDFLASPSHPDDLFVSGDYLFVTDDDSDSALQGLYIFSFTSN